MQKLLELRRLLKQFVPNRHMVDLDLGLCRHPQDEMLDELVIEDSVQFLTSISDLPRLRDRPHVFSLSIEILILTGLDGTPQF